MNLRFLKNASQTKFPKFIFEHSMSVMERQLNSNSCYFNRNSTVLPVVLCLTLPTPNIHQNLRKDINRKVKRQKQKQRDEERMKVLHELKSVSSLFSFSSLDNNEVRAMTSKPVSIQFSKPERNSEKSKLLALQQENHKLTVLIADIPANVRTVNEKLKHIESEKSDMQCRLLEE